LVVALVPPVPVVPALPDDDVPALPEEEVPALPEDDVPAVPDDDVPALPGEEVPAVPGEAVPPAPVPDVPAVPVFEDSAGAQPDEAIACAAVTNKATTNRFRIPRKLSRSGSRTTPGGVPAL